MTDIWGPSTWNFIHNLADKIEEEHFEKSISHVWNKIITLVKNLPCQHCSQHAYALLKKINIRSINDKKILKELLFRFHNVVNKKLKKDIRNIEILSMYTEISLKKSLYDLTVSWNKIANKMTIHEYANKVKILNTVSQLTNWIKVNKRVFIGLE